MGRNRQDEQQQLHRGQDSPLRRRHRRSQNSGCARSLRAGLVRPDGGESGEFSVQLVFSGDGETPPDALCGVVLRSAWHAGILEMSLVTTSTGSGYAVALKVIALNNGNARIIGHVKKNLPLWWLPIVITCFRI